MTMSMVGAPTANPVPRPAADGDAAAGQPGAESAGDGGFAGLVAALVAATGQAPIADPTVAPTADQQTAAPPDETGPDQLGGDIADQVDVPAGIVRPGIEALVIGALGTVPVGTVATAGAATAVAVAAPSAAGVTVDPDQTATAPGPPSGPADSTDASICPFTSHLSLAWQLPPD